MDLPKEPTEKVQKRREYSPHTRTRVAMLYFSGAKPREISKSEGVPPGSVRGIVSRYKRQTSAKSSPRSGRPRILTDRDKRHINRCVQEDPLITVRSLVDKIGGHVSDTTVANYLREVGLHPSQASQRPNAVSKNGQKGSKTSKP